MLAEILSETLAGLALILVWSIVGFTLLVCAVFAVIILYPPLWLLYKVNKFKKRQQEMEKRQRKRQKQYKEKLKRENDKYGIGDFSWKS